MLVDAQLESFLKFLSKWDKWQSPETLFLSIDHLLEDLKIQGRSYLFSLPTDPEIAIQKELEDSIRVLWNKNTYDQMGKKLFSKDEFETLVQKESIQRENADIYYLGTYSGQAFVMVLEHQGRFPQSLLKYFLPHVRDGFFQLHKISEVDKYIDLAQQDDVTGLFNQRKLVKDLSFYIKKNAITSESFSLLFIDIDYFKQVNDGHGHIVGTQLLVQLSKLLKAGMRDKDLLYRYGGDEFVMLLPSVDTEVGKKVGERILEKVNRSNFIFKDDLNLKIGLSIGVAEFPKNAATSEAIIEMADKMMYQAKSGGRGRVCSADDMLNLPIKKAD